MEVQLERKLGLWAVIALGIGATIGSGIFSTISEVAAIAGSGLILIISFIIGGLLQIPANFCYAELSSAYPENGGYYLYIKEAGSPSLAFFCGWASFWALDPPSVSIMALGLVNYMSIIFPIDEIYLRLITILIIAIFVTTNVMSVEAGGIVQTVLTILKIAPFILIIGLGIFCIDGNIFMNDINDFKQSVNNSPGWIFSIFAAIAATTFSYDGMYAPSYMTGEIKNPKKVMPVAFIAMAVVVILLYVGLSVVTCGILTPQEISTSAAPISTVASKIPVIGGYAGYIIAIMAIIVILGAISSATMYQPRLEYAMAKDGYFFKIFEKVHPKYKTPYWAIILSCLYTIVLTFIGNLSTILSYFTLITLIRNFSTFGSIFVLRKKTTYNPSYKCPCGLLFPAISCFVTLCLIIGIFFTNPIESVITIVVLVASGYVAYKIWKRKK